MWLFFVNPCGLLPNKKDVCIVIKPLQSEGMKQCKDFYMERCSLLNNVLLKNREIHKVSSLMFTSIALRTEKPLNRGLD